MRAAMARSASRAARRRLRRFWRPLAAAAASPTWASKSANASSAARQSPRPPQASARRKRALTVACSRSTTESFRRGRAAATSSASAASAGGTASTGGPWRKEVGAASQPEHALGRARSVPDEGILARHSIATPPPTRPTREEQLCHALRPAPLEPAPNAQLHQRCHQPPRAPSHARGMPLLQSMGHGQVEVRQGKPPRRPG
mmetsp:Transcript_11450/g.36447  ORF Transcript_11450/g.36447 Transcript_11450/m.36447 type:complete len:202 (-) Transcript_11450:139-744(-)